MILRYYQVRKQINQIKDAVVFCLALWLAHWSRVTFTGQVPGWEKEIEPFTSFLPLYFVIVPVVPIILGMLGYYNRPFITRRLETAWILLKGCFFTTVGMILLMFFLKESLARSVIISFGVISFVFSFIYEEFRRAIYNSKLAPIRYRQRFIHIGSRCDTSWFLKNGKRALHDEIEVVAQVDLNDCAVAGLVDLLHEHSANGVIINAKHIFFGEIEKVVQACELEGVEVWLVADFFKTQISRTTFDEFQGQPMLVFRSAPEASGQFLAKHFLDFFGALLALLLVAPFFGVVALLVRLGSPGPVFFRQQRCGLNGHPFTMLKFRSMVSNAEQRKDELAAFNEMSGPVFKLTNDPRVTRMGRFLRKYSIDEWPQLLNVLRGEMSLVGPRPLPVDEVRRFDDLSHRRRLSVKPGLTCLWQISGRNDVKDFEDWVRLDLEYIDHWSIWLDLKIILRTIPVVLIGTGAR